MLNPNFVILGVLIGSIGGVSYLIDTLKGKVKPNKVSYLLWTLAPSIILAAQIQEGVGIQVLMTLSFVLIPLLIFIAFFLNKKAKWKVTKFDLFCGSFSVLGLILWYITKQGNVAIIFSLLADGFAALPTLIKSYHHPETESGWPYLMGTINSIITLLTITT